MQYRSDQLNSEPAFAAPDAQLGVNVAFAVDKAYRALGTDLLAGGRQTVLAALRHPVLVGGADVAGIGDNVDQRRFVVLLGDGGVIHALGHQAPGLDAADGKTHGQPHPLTGNGPLKENGLPVQWLIAGNDQKGQILGFGVVLAGIGEPGNLCEYFLSNVGDERRNPTHRATS